MVWSTILAHIITLQPPLRLLLAEGTAEEDTIFPLVYPSGLSNVTRDFSAKNYFGKDNLQVFLHQLLMLKIFDFMKRTFFTDTNSQSILHFLFFLTSSIPAFLKSESLVKSNHFALTCFSLCSSKESKFLKNFFFLRENWSYFQQSPLSLDDHCKSLISQKWTFSHSITLLFSVLAVVRSFPLLIFQCILWTERKKNY